jgi:hypothetical protein
MEYSETVDVSRKSIIFNNLEPFSPDVRKL